LRDFQISEREQEIIRKHMWPLTVIPPTCKEAWVVNAVDTASSIVEVLAEYRMFKKLRRRWLTSKLELLKEVRESL
ncbi:phosphohydrolase, partial [Erysipelatoclostridium ramosum]|nr:phosphohydrolase [Thomasclavelia ramosa]